MKCSRLLALPLSFLILILIAGCSPSDDCDDCDCGGGDGTAPDIVSVEIHLCTSSTQDLCYNPRSYLNIGDYYNIKINCSDPDRDIRYIHKLSYHLVSGNYEIYSGPDTNEVPSQSGEHYFFYYWLTNKVMDFAPNTYKFEYQLEDAEGNVSDTFIVFLEVLD